MNKDSAGRKKKLILSLSLILAASFLATSLISYFISMSTLRRQITTATLPLTSDNVFSEIKRELLRPVFISSMMAHDVFLRDWVLAGEQDESLITRYLHEIMARFDTFTAFFVSEKSRIYYQARGILKRVEEQEERDVWFFRVREMPEDYELNVDPDLANLDALTVFINHRVLDYQGDFIGVAGVGLTINFVNQLIAEYGDKFNREIFFVDSGGEVVLRSDGRQNGPQNIRAMQVFAARAEDILAGRDLAFRSRNNGNLIHVSSRFVPELNWHLLVTLDETDASGRALTALVVNLLISIGITLLVLLLTTLTINAFQRTSNRQQEEIIRQHRELETKNSELEAALSEVKTLSGLIPICASCKKIRDDQGFWQQIETYIRERSDASFSHGICPDCLKKLYPGHRAGKKKD